MKSSPHLRQLRRPDQAILNGRVPAFWRMRSFLTEDTCPRPPSCFQDRAPRSLVWGGRLCETLPAARRLYGQGSAILGYDLEKVCAEGPAERLNATDVSQPAIFVTSLAALQSLSASDPAAAEECSSTAGLSLGEYTALVFAGAVSFEDGLKIVKRRGEAMQAASDATPSGMVSVLGLEESKVEELCAAARACGSLEIANRLCPGNIAVSGVKAACSELERLAEAVGARTIRLAVAGAFHTNLMKPADEALATALNWNRNPPAARPGLVECRCDAPFRPGRDSQPPCPPGRPARLVGADDAQFARRRRGQLLRDWSGACTGRIAKTGAPKGRMSQHSCLIGLFAYPFLLIYYCVVI